MRRRLGILLVLLAAGCSGGGATADGASPAQGGGNPPTNPPPGAGTTTTQPTAPATAAPPVGVTWHVGVTENVSRARLQNLYASFVAANNFLWNLSEGQVRVDKFVISDNVGPGVSASQFLFSFGPPPFPTNTLDIVVWPAGMWDVPASGAVGEIPGQGRTSRLMVIPENASTFVLGHEGSHFLFRLTWSVGALLVDEYADGVQDPACVMESQNLPSRWCSDANHSNQSSQPHACWRQILADYPLLRYTGADAAPALPPVPQVEYHDTP